MDLLGKHVTVPTVLREVTAAAAAAAASQKLSLPPRPPLSVLPLTVSEGDNDSISFSKGAIQNLSEEARLPSSPPAVCLFPILRRGGSRHGAGSLNDCWREELFNRGSKI